MYRSDPTVVVSLCCVVVSGAAVDCLFTAVDQVGGGPRVCQPRVVAYVSSQHAGPKETHWLYFLEYDETNERPDGHT